MKCLFSIVCLMAVASFAATPAPHKPPVQILDEMIKDVREVQSTLRKEAQTQDKSLEANWSTRLDPVGQSVNDLTRSSMQGGAAPSAYGLRLLLNNLRAAHSPKQALEMSEQFIEAVAFLRSEYHLASQRQVSPPAAAVPRVNAREVALEILHRSEFQQATKPHFFDYYFNRFIVKAIVWLQGIFDSAAMRQAGTFAYAFLWAVYGLMAFLVIWIVRRNWSPRRKLGEETKGGPVNGIALQTPEIHLAEAEALSRQGNFAAAIREYFLMMLATLEQRSFVPRNRSWTNWEYLRAFGARVSDDSMRGSMGQLNSVYDRVSYGGQPCDESAYTTFRTNVDKFLSALAGLPARMKDEG